MVWLCAAHQTNLVVHVAICGKLLADPINANALCGTCARLFKYLINDYFEEFSSSLRHYVATQFELVDCSVDQRALHQSRVSDLVALYGHDVLPESLLRFYNVCSTAPQHCPDGPVDIREVRGQLFLELQKYVLCVEEHPIVTRFWLFGQCVRTLLLVLWPLKAQLLA